MKQSLSSKKNEIHQLVGKIVDPYLSKEYNLEEGQSWISQITDDVVKELKSYNEFFKYCCNAFMIPKGDAGMSLNSYCLWDSQSDSGFTIHSSNKTMDFIVIVYALPKSI
jgi:hypothetical protein